jgi:hypothetical protein
VLKVKHEFLYMLLVGGKINTFLSKLCYLIMTKEFNWTTDCLVAPRSRLSTAIPLLPL